MINHFSTPRTQNAPISMTLASTFLYASGLAKALTLDETFDFYVNLDEEKGHKFDGLDKATKKDFIENKLEENKEQAFAFGMVEDKCRWSREDISLSRFSISKSVRLQRK